MKIFPTNHVEADKERDFERIFKAAYPKLYYYALSFMDDEEACKDIVSDVFEAFWQEYDSIRKETLTAYLYACTRNRCIDSLRQQSVRRSYAEQMAQGVEEAETDDPEEQDERLKRIHQAIEAMPPGRKRVLKECFFRKKSYKEVAGELGITTDGVKRHITLALKTLRMIFSE